MRAIGTDGDEPDRGVGVLLTVAGWTGGGLVTAIVVQAARVPGGATMATDPLQAFYAVVAGCLLAGPLLAGALLWRWGQPRVVGSVAVLSAAAVVGVLPLMAVVESLVRNGGTLIGILVFVTVWGVVLPAAARAFVIRSTHRALVHDFDEPAAGTDTSPWSLADASSSGLPAGPPIDPTLPPVQVPHDAWR